MMYGYDIYYPRKQIETSHWRPQEFGMCPFENIRTIMLDTWVDVPYGRSTVDVYLKKE